MTSPLVEGHVRQRLACRSRYHAAARGPAQRDQDINLGEARRVIQGWMKLIALSPPFALANPPFLLVEQEDMTVRDYLSSHPLDYDDLSL